MGFSCEIETHRQPQPIHLFIGFLAGIVLVLIVRIEFDVLSEGEVGACVELGGTKLAVLAFVVKLAAGIGQDVVRVNREGALQRWLIAIAPCKRSVAPVEICTVSVCE
jgi:hypothetical protein